MTIFTPQNRIILFFFAQSMSVGLANSFAGVWFSSQGLSEAQIGLINSAPIAVLVLISLFVGRRADRARDWRNVIIFGAIASFVFPLGLFAAQGFVGTLVFWTLAVIAQWAVVPVADAAALRHSRRHDADFGTVRAFGTMGYLLVIFCMGYVIKRFGIDVFLPCFVALCLIRALTSFALPQLRGDAAASKAPSKLSSVMQAWFLLPLIAWALIFSAHLVLNAFQGLLWAKQGIALDTIGILITLGAVAETIMFLSFKKFAVRFSPLRLIMLAGVVSIIRWVAMAQSPDVAVLLALQMLHAVTYALGFLACTNFIADSTSEDIAAEAQSFLVVLEQAVAIVVLIGFGWLAGMFGAKAYLGSAVVAMIAVICIALAPKQKEVLPQ